MRYEDELTYGDETAFKLDGRARLSHAWPRYLNVLLGTWLFASAFLWEHSRDARGASWLMGGMIAMNAFASIFASPARFANVIVGVMALVWHLTAGAEHPLTYLNGVLVSGLVIVLALLPSHKDARSYA
jgi:hypothetical protein